MNSARKLAGLQLRVPALYGTTITRMAATNFENALNENVK